MFDLTLLLSKNHSSPSCDPIVLAAGTDITHWFDPDVSHGGVESVLRVSQNTAYTIGGRVLVKRL